MFRALILFAIAACATTLVAADPLPPQADIDRELKEVRDVFAPALAGDAKPAAKLEAVTEMFEAAAEADTSAALAYALLVTARDVAAELGEVESVDKAVGQLAERFDVRRGSLSLPAYIVLAKQLAGKSTVVQGNFVQRGLVVVDFAHSEGEFESTVELLTSLDELARETKIPVLLEAVAKRRKAIPPPTAPSTAIAADRIELWNTHNSTHNDRGAKTANVYLYLGSREVSRQLNVEIPWEANKATSVTIKVASTLKFDRLRVELPDFRLDGTGLAEIDVFSGATNLAGKAVPIASDAYNKHGGWEDFQPAGVNDGVRDPANKSTNYWLLPDRTPGWIELEWTPEVTTPAAQALSKQLGYPLRRHPFSAKSFQGHWYAYYPGRSTVAVAKQRCQAMGGHLLIVETPEENKFCLDVTRKEVAWMDGHKEKDGTWRWSTGTPIQKMLWGPTEPQNYGHENWLMIAPSGWCDMPDHHALNKGFVCEWPF